MENKKKNKTSKELEILESILKKRGFFWQSEEIYGGMRGFYDYGVLGTKLKNNVIALWRRLFVHENEFLEIDGSSINSEKVFKASGHLDKFVDVVVKCKKCGAHYRADHLLKPMVKEAEALSLEEIEMMLKELSVSCQSCGGELSSPYTQNLMFELRVGSSTRAFLRPETAQSIFLNFHNLYRFNREKLPFGVAQIGRGFRNEISPRQGLIRLREFNMAEIEYFYDKNDEQLQKEILRKIKEKDYPFVKEKKRQNLNQLMKKYEMKVFDQGERYEKQSERKTEPFFEPPDFSTLLEEEISFVAAQKDKGIEKRMTFADAIEKGVISSPLLCHHLILAYAFMRMIGFKKEHLRFRQHLPHEMAHYASDCWDLEVSIKAGARREWLETIGIADRSAYDLTAHIKASGRDLRVFEKYEKPREEVMLKVILNMKEIGKVFKKESKTISEILSSAPQQTLVEIKKSKEELSKDGEGEGLNQVFLNLETGKVSFKKEEAAASHPSSLRSLPLHFIEVEECVEKVTGRRYIPSVIEPSYGIDRIIYSLLNNSIHREKKEGEDYTYFSFLPSVAPVTAGVFPLTKDERLVKLAKDIHNQLKAEGITAVYDENGSIGRRYARMDEIGTPFCITVDFDTVEDKSVTIRFINTSQLRVPLTSLVPVLTEFIKAF